MGTPVPTDDLPAGTAVPDDDLPAASGNSATYVPPTMGGGNSWLDVIKGAPQAIASGFNRGVLDVAGIPMDTATNVANLAKAGIGYTDSKLTGQEPPAWTLPSDPADVTGTSAWLNKWAAKPAGGSIVNVTGDPQSYIDQGLNATYEQIGTGALGVAGEPAAAEFSAGKTAAMTPEEVVRANTPAEQSMGAAAASPRLANTSPELRQAIVGAAQRTGGAVNPDALARHIQADTLPVPVALTEGQALQDPMRLSTEQNLRGQQPDLAKRFNQQNGALVQNFQALRDQVGPDVYTTNPVEHGDTLIKAYQDKAATAEADIDAKYQALRDANGGKFPIDVKQLTTNVEQALHQNLLYEHAPTELGQLQSLAKNGNMTFEQFEAMRTNLARTMRSSTDGNERAAAGAIRQQMENLPLSGQTASLKPLADAARSAARTQFQALEADPAYKAAVAGSVSPDRFVQKFVIGAPRDQVAVMKQNLAHDPVAQQTMGVATVDHLRRSAGIDEMGNGNFSQAGFNKQRQALDPKLRTLVGPQVSETLEQLGDVARYTQAQPRGSFVNNSNTFVSQAAEHAKSLAEAAINAKTGGIPVASWARKAATGREGRAYVRKALAPGAGLGELKP